MRDRLIEVLNNIQTVGTKVTQKKDIYYGKYIDEEDFSNEQVADHILADGWIRPPCKVGDTVYTYDYLDYTYKLRESTVKAIKIQKNTMTNIQEFLIEYFYIENLFVWGGHGIFGDNVFLTREEAEAKPKEGVQG